MTPADAIAAVREAARDPNDDSRPLMVLPPQSSPVPVKRRGHIGWPGRGPTGETCGSCCHYVTRHSGARTHPKCALMKASWTNGAGSDIRRKDPACEMWAASGSGAIPLPRAGEIWRNTKTGQELVVFDVEPATQISEIGIRYVRRGQFIERPWIKAISEWFAKDENGLPLLDLVSVP